MNKSKIWIILVIALTVGGGVYLGQATFVDKISLERDKVKTVDAEQLRDILKQCNGRPLILNYWATWCDSCKPNLKKMGSLFTKYKEQNLCVVGVALDSPQDPIQLALVEYLYAAAGEYTAKTVSQHNQTEEVMTVIDPDWLEIVPVYYLIDTSGKVVERFVGSRSLQNLTKRLSKLMEM